VNADGLQLEPVSAECAESWATVLAMFEFYVFDSSLQCTYLWPPYGIGQAIIFSSCGFFFPFLCSFFLA